MLDEYKDILTTQELADILQLNIKTIIKLSKEKKLPSVKIAGQYRFSKERIIEWIESGLKDSTNKFLQDFENDVNDIDIQIHKLLFPYNIIINLKSTNKIDIIKELVIFPENNNPINNKEELIAQIINRENSRSTALGKGIAFPHPRTISKNIVKNGVLKLGISREGIDFNASDNIPVKIVFMLAFPNLSLHLKVLSKLTRLFKNEQLTLEIYEQNQTSEKVIEIIKKYEKAID